MRVRGLGSLAICAVALSSCAAVTRALPNQTQRAEAAGALKVVQTICIAHRADPAGALAAADAGGWRVAPAGGVSGEGGLQPAMDGRHLKVAAARFKPTAGGGMVLLLGDEDGAPGCVVAFHAAFKSASAILYDAMPIRRSEVGESYDLWIYIEENGRKTRVRPGGIDTAAMDAAAANGTLHRLAVIGTVTRGPSEQARAEATGAPLPGEAALNASVYYYSAPGVTKVTGGTSTTSDRARPRRP